MIITKKSVRQFLVDLSRPSKQVVMVLIDLLGYLTCVYFVDWLLAGNSSQYFAVNLIALITIAIALPFGWLSGLYGTIVRYVGIEFLIRTCAMAGMSSVAIVMLAHYASIVDDPYRWGALLWINLLIYICFSRYVSRILLGPKRDTNSLEPVLIYGAGSAGAQLASYLHNSGLAYPVAMIDDDLSLAGKRVKGLRVFTPADLETLLIKKRISRVLLALPRVSRRRRRAILDKIEGYSVRVQTIPDFDDLVAGKARVEDIRDIPLADLMGRSAVPPNAKLLHGNIEHKNVMVTGAGGSIGSELCRQIVILKAVRLILFENSEVALYKITQELRALSEERSLICEVVPLLGSICDAGRVEEVLTIYDIHTVYHAAAYKHVPIVEQNLLEGINNNSIGTMQLATVACQVGVETFVLISTDKAVRPANAMGATKRLAELVVQAIQQEFPATRLCIVRFGNVLDSSGSVVPLFRDQIKNGGPVTVTHRDIVRYFMTIPEAAQLVIQASSMANGGDVFVLDMGQPVRIQDLAIRMIRLMGLTVCDKSNPDGDIEIQYIGLRPAEKLYEELLMGDDVLGTEHPRIMRAIEKFEPYTLLLERLRQLTDASDDQDSAAARDILFDIVSKGQPNSAIEDLVWTAKNSGSKKVVDSNVTTLVSKLK
jgi:FlaA1/EpsC-like NDP-sugar epimerase